MATDAVLSHILAELQDIRRDVSIIVPGGRDPEDGYIAKRDALRRIDRLIGDETRGLLRRV